MNVNGRVYIDYDGLWYLMKSVVARKYMKAGMAEEVEQMRK